jgi:hypothetical protein
MRARAVRRRREGGLGVGPSEQAGVMVALITRAEA